MVVRKGSVFPRMRYLGSSLHLKRDAKSTPVCWVVESLVWALCGHHCRRLGRHVRGQRPCRGSTFNLGLNGSRGISSMHVDLVQTKLLMESVDSTYLTGRPRIW